MILLNSRGGMDDFVHGIINGFSDDHQSLTESVEDSSYLKVY